ncbi:MAG: hypothetical protein IPP60_07470 [Sphingobacteriales bacterium]|nr:hypothetical protein [Sphingobacteriales bacterium]
MLFDITGQLKSNPCFGAHKLYTSRSPSVSVAEKSILSCLKIQIKLGALRLKEGELLHAATVLEGISNCKSATNTSYVKNIGDIRISAASLIN